MASVIHNKVSKKTFIFLRPWELRAYALGLTVAVQAVTAISEKPPAPPNPSNEDTEETSDQPQPSVAPEVREKCANTIAVPDNVCRARNPMAPRLDLREHLDYGEARINW